MTETGIIREIRGNLLIIATAPPASNIECFGCLKGECRNIQRFITAKNPEAFPIKTGQMVEVSAPGSALLGQALVSFLPPIAGFMAGYTLARLLFPGAGEGAFAGAGVILLFAGALVIYKARKRKSALEAYTVTRIIG